jgi:hypothetical protein
MSLITLYKIIIKTAGSLGDHGPTRLRDEDDEILQFAIQQSLLDVGTEDEQVNLHMDLLTTTMQFRTCFFLIILKLFFKNILLNFTHYIVWIVITT